jgi:hypothetical protein
VPEVDLWPGQLGVIVTFDLYLGLAKPF